jgi:hypothetical protein
MEKPTFIVSDQSVNCYGFILLTGGIDIEGFKKNPIMLYNHINEESPSDAIGVWENLRVESTQLLADAVIDPDDEFSSKVLAKVNKGILKAASVRFDFDFEDVVLGMQGFENVPVITKCKLSEISICPVPGNSNAVRLFANGERITDESKATAFLNNKLKPEIINPMKKIALFASALGLALSENTSEDHILEAVNSLKADRDALKLKNDEYLKKFEKIEEQKVTDLIEKGVKEGKLKADQKDHFTKLAKQDFDTTKNIIDSMPVYQSIASQLNNGNEKKDKYEGLNFRDLQKNHSAELARIKAEEPERYKQLQIEAGIIKG